MHGMKETRAVGMRGLSTRLVAALMITGLVIGLAWGACSDQEVVFPDPNLEAAIREAIRQPEGPIMESKLATVMYLTANECEIVDLSGIEYCTGATHVFLAGNLIADVAPLAGLANVQFLELSRNQIADVEPLGNLSTLKMLYVSGNQIVDISPIARIEGLSQLHAANNRISDVGPVAQMTSYGMLDLSGNLISDISPLATGERYSWTDLDLSNNQIADVGPLAGFGMLWRLYLSNNQIVDVSPLAGLDRLLLLWLDGNQIEEFPVIEGFLKDPAWRVPAFHETYEISCEYPHLNLANNALRSLEGLETNPNLREGHYIDLSGNPFDRGMRSPNAIAITRLRTRGVTVCL